MSPRFAGALFVASILLLTGCGTSSPTGTVSPPAASDARSTPGTVTASAPSVSPSPSQPSEPAALELPRGGTNLFPAFRLFGYSGYPGAPGQGRLGIGNIDDRMKELEQRGQAYRGGRELMPVMELIAVTVQGSPGSDGMFRVRTSDAVVKKWFDAATRHKALLLLNIQPGRANFIDEVKHFEKWLKYPNVGLALDPEWAVDKGQVPGRVFGHTSGQELDTVAKYVSGVIAANHLPDKVMLFHQLNRGVIEHPKDLKQYSGVTYINSVDGIGSPGAKTSTYNAVIKTRPKFVHAGFKLFYVEDKLPKYNGGSVGRLMTPKEVLKLKPQPEYILFE